MGLVESGKIPKPLTKLLNSARKYSLWVYQWGLACCAIEMGSAFASPRYDGRRLGVIPFPASAGGAMGASGDATAGEVTSIAAPPCARHRAGRGPAAR